jgi:superfamily I DNA/RNA helicase
MCYDDAYALSFAYIRDFGDKLKKIFGKRFAYVFIDEMQDTDKQQLMLIEELFSDDGIEIQKIGDNNQAIYSSTVSEQNLWSVNSTNLTINGSKRFSRAIAEKVKLLALNQQEIIGNTSLPDINPKILVFNDNTISRVLSKFAEIIISNNLNLNEKNVFKAVGWVGQIKDKRTIPSYYNNYVSKRNTTRQDYDCLKGYLQKCPSEIVQNEVVEHYRHKIIRALLKVLSVLNFKDIKDRYYTETSLTQQIFKKTGNKHFYDNFRFSMATWCLKLLRNEDVYNNFKSFIIEEFLPLFNVTDLSYITPFLDGEIDDDQVSYVSDRDNIHKQDEIEIQVSTIHGVKGETHTATLYLETHFHQYDIKKIIDYMKGNFHEPQPREKEALKMAYVGMSRPSHLLCIAAHIDSINGHEEGLKNIGWEIVEVA